MTILPRRGFRINELTAKTIKDLFGFRRPLEQAIILFIGPDLTPATNRKMESMMDRIIAAKDPVVFSKVRPGLSPVSGRTVGQ